jgi:DNA-binding CsgD family transcriptional regulator
VNVPQPHAQPSEIVGRATDLEAIDRFLDRLAGEPAAIVFEGLPGIGKTTVWHGTFQRAGERSLTVLSCRPVEAEAKLAFASLADLLEPVAEAVLPRIPEPQRLALAVALMRASPQGATPSARAVATAALSALRVLADGAPVVLAIDDQQWLDRASAEALAFALRRLDASRVGVVATVRVRDDGARDPLGLDGAFAGRIERRRLGPLSLSALHHVIRTQLGHVFPRPALRRIADASGGNPFFAIELARALTESAAHPGPGEPLPVPDTLASLVQRRLDRLPARVRGGLLLVSALSAPTVDVVCRALGRDGGDTLARAEEARIIEVHDGHVRFTHPLLAAALYSSAAAERRREVHARLASVIAAPEKRARHLALAAPGPDEAVARALDDAAVLARRRGAPDAAGELQEHAARLTPRGDAEAGRRRRTRAAEHFFHAGSRAHARALLEAVLAETPAGQERAAALHLLGRVRGQEDSFADAIGHLEEALAYSVEAPASVAIRLDLAFAIYSVGDLTRAVSVANDTLVDAERLGDPGLIANALGLVVLGRFIAGLGSDYAGLERALALEDRSRGGQLMLRPSAIAGLLALYEGRIPEADRLLRGLCDWAAERGEESETPFLLINLSWLEWWRGDFAAAAAYAEKALLIAVEAGSATMHTVALVLRGRARAARGDVAGARADLSQGRTLIDQTGFLQNLPWLLATEGLLELSLGDAEAAEHTLAPLVALVEATGIGETFIAYFLPDAVEALIRVGEPARAEALLEQFARRGEELGRLWAIAAATRCRSILLAARGDLDAALTAAKEAVDHCRQLEMPTELGRTLLALGQVQRRRGERREARDTLERARTLFLDLGAPLWAERAADELRRIPIRRGAPDELTPTEERVAALAAAGRTNKQVAKALFMSPKTVEANLGRVYAKLGIRSRAELGARMAERRGARRPAEK